MQNIYIIILNKWLVMQAYYNKTYRRSTQLALLATPTSEVGVASETKIMHPCLRNVWSEKKHAGDLESI